MLQYLRFSSRGYYSACLFVFMSCGLKKIGGTESCNFSTDGCKFPTEDIMRAQNCTFAPKCSQNVGFFLSQMLYFWTKSFRREENFPTD